MKGKIIIKTTNIIRTLVSFFVSLFLAFISTFCCYADEINGGSTATISNYSTPVQEIANEYINAFPELENEIWGTIEIVIEMPGFISALEYDEKTAYDLLRNGLNSLLGSYAISTYGADYRG